MGKIFHLEAGYESGRLFKIKDGWRGKNKDYSLVHGGMIHMIDLVMWLLEFFEKKRVYEILSNGNNICSEKFKYKKLEGYQEKVEVQLDDLPIPIIGYIDFLFDNTIVDLKTTARIPSKPTESQKRQMALYSMAYPDKKVDLFFASSKDSKKFSLRSLSAYKKQIKTVAFTIQRFLSLSEDKHTLAQYEFPNTDSWMWSDKMKKEAEKIW